MIKELNHIGLMTGNMDGARNFYEKVLGGIVIRDFKNAEGLSQFVYVQLARGVIELIRVAPDSANKGYAHVAFLTDQKKTLEEYHQDLVSKGYEFTVAPKAAASGDGRLAFYKDTSGAVFELIERNENIRVRDHVSSVLKACNYTALYTSSKSAADSGKFYEGSMGFVKTDSLAAGRDIYSIGEDSLLLCEAEGNGAAIRHICYCVSDITAMERRLSDAGVKFETGTVLDGTKGITAWGPDGETVVFTARETKK